MYRQPGSRPSARVLLWWDLPSDTNRTETTNKPPAAAPRAAAAAAAAAIDEAYRRARRVQRCSEKHAAEALVDLQPLGEGPLQVQRRLPVLRLLLLVLARGANGQHSPNTAECGN